MEQKDFDQLREFTLSLRRNVTSKLDYNYRMAVLIESCVRELRSAQQSVQPTVESGRVLPAKKSNRKGSAPASSG